MVQGGRNVSSQVGGRTEGRYAGACKIWGRGRYKNASHTVIEYDNLHVTRSFSQH